MPTTLASRLRAKWISSQPARIGQDVKKVSAEERGGVRPVCKMTQCDWSGMMVCAGLANPSSSVQYSGPGPRSKCNGVLCYSHHPHFGDCAGVIAFTELVAAFFPALLCACAASSPTASHLASFCWLSTRVMPVGGSCNEQAGDELHTRSMHVNGNPAQIFRPAQRVMLRAFEHKIQQCEGMGAGATITNTILGFLAVGAL